MIWHDPLDPHPKPPRRFFCPKIIYGTFSGLKFNPDRNGTQKIHIALQSHLAEKLQKELLELGEARAAKGLILENLDRPLG